MKVLIILGHPNKNSFNHAIANKCKEKLVENGHSVIFHDLHEERFDPVITSEEIPKDGKIEKMVQQHCIDLIQAEAIIIVHPNWWGQPPAILKGWIDRIIRPGIAYEFKEGDNGEGVPKGLLKAKLAIVFNTSDTNSQREAYIFGDPLETIWRNCIFNLCGVNQFERRNFSIMVTSNQSQRLQWLKEVGDTIDKYFPQGKIE